MGPVGSKNGKEAQNKAIFQKNKDFNEVSGKKVLKLYPSNQGRQYGGAGGPAPLLSRKLTLWGFQNGGQLVQKIDIFEKLKKNKIDLNKK